MCFISNINIPDQTIVPNKTTYFQPQNKIRSRFVTFCSETVTWYFRTVLLVNVLKQNQNVVTNCNNNPLSLLLIHASTNYFQDIPNWPSDPETPISTHRHLFLGFSATRHKFPLQPGPRRVGAVTSPRFGGVATLLTCRRRAASRASLVEKFGRFALSGAFARRKCEGRFECKFGCGVRERGAVVGSENFGGGKFVVDFLKRLLQRKKWGFYFNSGFEAEKRRR